MKAPSLKRLDARPLLQGFCWGLIAVLAWGGYNVVAKMARLEGFSAADLTLLRYGGGALFFLPFLIAGATGSRLSFGKTIVSTILIGPIWGLVINTAFGLAPLSHAVVISPGVAMLVGNVLPLVLDGKRLPLSRWLGCAILVIGLLVIGLNRQTASPVHQQWVWLGDMGFVYTGATWAIFGYLLGKWRVTAFVGIGQISVLSALVFLPVYLLGFVPHQAPASSWLVQLVLQGGLGGFLSWAAFAMTVKSIGSSRASILPAFVPSSAILLAIPLMQVLPTPPEIIGVIVSTIGLATAVGFGSSASSSLERSPPS